MSRYDWIRGVSWRMSAACSIRYGRYDWRVTVLVIVTVIDYVTVPVIDYVIDYVSANLIEI